MSMRADDQGGELTDRDRGMLELERKHFKYLGRKETIVVERFEMSLTRYFQVLNGLLDKPAALAYDAQTVRRLQRLRDARQARRGARVGWS